MIRDMNLILSIDTAVSVCSVALHAEGVMIGLLEIHQENVHAQRLMPAIDALLSQCGVQARSLSAIAVSEGPGSYTGLRIGVSTAKGIAFANSIPLIGVSTLKALAKQVQPYMATGDLVVPMIDARRMEVYREVFNKELASLYSLEPEIIDENSFADILARGKVYFVGDGVAKAEEVILHPNAVFLKKTNSATAIGELAYEKYQRKVFEDIAYFEPNYLKEFKVLKSKKNPLAL